MTDIAQHPELAAFDPARAFSGKIGRVRSSLIYRFVLMVGTVLMLALPLVYLGMVGFLGYGLYEFAMATLPLDPAVRRVHAQRLPFAVETPPRPGYRQEPDSNFYPVIVLIGGVIVIFFLLKPLLARPAKGISPRALRPEDQPLLFAFVRELSANVGAPMPRRIQVDCEVNASAGPTRGAFSVLARDLTLTIGLPLAAGMNLRELTGVLAHEFGHFSQGGAMLARVVILRVVHWFARVVYERDSWDVALSNLSRRIDIRLAIFFMAIRLCVWLSRRVLWVLMHVGGFFSLVLARQMEYDADRYEARVSGSDHFRATTERLHLLMLAWQKTQADLEEAMRERRLGDNLPAVITANADRFPEEIRTRYLEKVFAARTGLLQTHPAPRARVAAAEREKCPGILTDERPASGLFRDFDGLCKMVTMDLYAAALGGEVARHTLVDSSEFIGQQRKIEASCEATMGFYLGCIDVDRPPALSPSDLGPPENPRETALELKRARERVGALAAQAVAANKLLLDAWKLETEAFIAEETLKAHLPFKVNPKLRGSAEIEAQRAKARGMIDEGEMVILPLEDALRARITASVKLMHTPQVAARIPEAVELIAQARAVVAALAGYRGAMGPIGDLRRSATLLSFILSHIKGSTSNKHIVDKAFATAREAARAIDRSCEALRHVAYPFQHGTNDATMSHYLNERPPNPKDVMDTFQKCEEIMQKLNQFFVRALGELGQISERVEAELKLAPVGKSEN